MRKRVLFLIVFAAALAIVGWFLRKPDLSNRTYRVGWQNSPPYQVSTNWEPTGLGVDLLREAAQRRGMKLTWVQWQQSSESALRARAVDLWPIFTITPERLKTFHISDPYMEAEHALLVRADSSYQGSDDLRRATIAVADSPIDDVLVHAYSPSARVVEVSSRLSLIEKVCRQEVDAGFMDVYILISALLNPPDCGGHGLRAITVPNSLTKLGIGATIESGQAADELRSEIGNMTRDGNAAKIIAKWGFTPAKSLVSLEALVDARRRGARLAVAAAFFALLFGLACWQAILVMREKGRSKRAEQALRAADKKLLLLANNLKEMVLAYDLDRKLTYANPAVETLTGYSLSEVIAHGFIDWVHPDDRERMMSHWDGLFRGGSFQDEEYHLVAKDGAIKWVSATWGPILDEKGRQVGVQGSEHDITDRKRAEEALMQARKMESIGRLAGGVAHDFNNLLTIINGYAELLLVTAAADAPERAQLEQIRRAGERAAELTKQLLAYSRKQVMQPERLDLNGVVTDSEPMFRRLLGEEIELIVKLQPVLGLVMAEAGQIHQVLMNLLVNARDAMPSGGKLFVETANVEIDQTFVEEHPEAMAGPAVLLEVTDSGSGMDDETKRNIFEPFFTTKGPGVGTGLGLATVYGIVKQSQGWIMLYSKPGEGTSFKIYFPRISGRMPGSTAAQSDCNQVRGSETVLLVEDQDEVRVFAARVLRSYGYTVLSAADGLKGLELAAQHLGPIHILLTDVVLPGMNGRQLADRLAVQRPETKVLYTSGYTQDVIAHRGVLDADVAYITKPYSPEALGARLREVIELQRN